MVTDKSPRTQEIAKIDESEQVETSERSVVTYLVIASESQQCKDIIRVFFQLFIYISDVSASVMTVQLILNTCFAYISHIFNSRYIGFRKLNTFKVEPSVTFFTS
jgi:hypothetical protein